MDSCIPKEEEEEEVFVGAYMHVKSTEIPALPKR
jgi:hypothetical protein